MARKTPRKQLFVDSKMQGALLVRMVFYWFFCVLAVGQFLLVWIISKEPPGPFLEQFRFDLLWGLYGPVAIASLFILPLLLLDTAFISNRIAGPLLRLRRSLKALAAGESVQPIHLRPKDYCGELTDEFNAVLAYVERLKQQIPKAAGGASRVAEDEPEHEVALH